ncbi:hypothetical protein C8J56DRAFT_895499 [Mycena floridula]|nr:hypothetical protein C8J56DRAFT_895499 [Mycena floridula]
MDRSGIPSPLIVIESSLCAAESKVIYRVRPCRDRDLTASILELPRPLSFGSSYLVWQNHDSIPHRTPSAARFMSQQSVIQFLLRRLTFNPCRPPLEKSSIDQRTRISQLEFHGFLALVWALDPPRKLTIDDTSLVRHLASLEKKADTSMVMNRPGSRTIFDGIIFVDRPRQSNQVIHEELERARSLRSSRRYRGSSETVFRFGLNLKRREKEKESRIRADRYGQDMVWVAFAGYG